MIEAVHGRRSIVPGADGLQNLEAELRAELDVLLAGKSRAEFPRLTSTTMPAAATHPAAGGPGGPALVVAPQHRRQINPAESHVAFMVPLRNTGAETLKLIDVRPGGGVTIDPEPPADIPSGGVAFLHCKVPAPDRSAQAFSRHVELRTNDPDRASVTIALTVSPVDSRASASR